LFIMRLQYPLVLETGQQAMFTRNSTVPTRRMRRALTR